MLSNRHLMRFVFLICLDRWLLQIADVDLNDVVVVFELIERLDDLILLLSYSFLPHFEAFFFTSAKSFSDTQKKNCLKCFLSHLRQPLFSPTWAYSFVSSYS